MTMILDPVRVTITSRATGQRMHPTLWQVKLDGRTIAERITEPTREDALGIAAAWLNPAPSVVYVAPQRGPKRRGQEIQPSEDD